MLRLRFSSGLLLGLMVGVLAGASLVLLWKRPPGPEQETLALEVQDLNRRLEDTRGERDRLLRQVEQFEKLASEMTASLASLEQRVTTLQAAHEEATRHQVEPTPTRTVREPTPTRPVPTAVPTEVPTLVPTEAPTAVEPPPETPSTEAGAETPAE
jgi:hypothetical protein